MRSAWRTTWRTRATSRTAHARSLRPPAPATPSSTCASPATTTSSRATLYLTSASSSSLLYRLSWWHAHVRSALRRWPHSSRPLASSQASAPTSSPRDSKCPVRMLTAGGSVASCLARSLPQSGARASCAIPGARPAASSWVMPPALRRRCATSRRFARQSSQRRSEPLNCQQMPNPRRSSRRPCRPHRISRLAVSMPAVWWSRPAASARVLQILRTANRTGVMKPSRQAASESSSSVSCACHSCEPEQCCADKRPARATPI
mmetsp:Transcript_122276/g.351255  ORF Transcript_122276/g.351255 Transcript_122276/m.351255 type:complete len:262 (+) Transcript_122276:352-1137(+)